MTVKCVKLDSRYKGARHFDYRIEIYKPAAARIPLFAELLKWCVATWDMSVPIDMYKTDLKFERNPHWAWSEGTNDWDGLYIYLATDKERELFTLRWL